MRLSRALARFETIVAAACLAIAFVVVLYSVFARWLGLPSSEWILELPMELLVVCAVFASGALLHEGRHLSVGIFVERLPVVWQGRVDRAVKVALAIVSAFLAQRAALAALQAARAGLHLPELFGMPTALPLAVTSLAITLWCVHLLVGAFAPRS